MSGEIVDTFANRNFMIRIQFIKYSRGESHCYAESWLMQRHPYGYFIDYFDTIESAKSSIAGDNAQRHNKLGYKHNYILYKLEEIE